MNREAYNEAWTKLLAARRSGNVGMVHQCAEELAHTARVLAIDGNSTSIEACEHKRGKNGYCVHCGHHSCMDPIPVNPMEKGKISK